jgi:hypothetical protein
MSNSCKDCLQIIDWNSKAREKLNTRRPLNPDGTIHSCNIGSRSSSKPIPEPNNCPNPITATAKAISPSSQTEDAALDALTLEFKMLLKHISEYLKEQKK